MKNYLKVTFVCFVFFFSLTLHAASHSLGTLNKGFLTLNVNNTRIGTYIIYDTHYVPVSKLKSAGFNVVYTTPHEPVYISSPTASLEIPQDSTNCELDGKAYTYYTGDVYIGYLKTQALLCEDSILIPVASLNSLFDSSLINNDYTLTPKVESPILTTQTSIKNCSEETVEVSITDLYWHNELIQNTLYFVLEPGQVLERPASGDKKYISTIVNTVTYPDFHYKNNSLCGQNNEELLRLIDFSTSLPEDTGDISDFSTLYKAYKTVNAKNLSSDTPYLVWTNLEEQRTYIFTSVNNTWQPMKCFICSSGKNSTPTPTGLYKLTKKVASFGQNHGYCCKNAFGFIGTTYLYHSILFDKTGTYLLEGRGVLGKKASDGCIRLSPENSLWFYNNMLPGTTVWIS